MIILDRK